MTSMCSVVNVHRSGVRRYVIIIVQWIKHNDPVVLRVCLNITIIINYEVNLIYNRSLLIDGIGDDV